MGPQINMKFDNIVVSMIDLGYDAGNTGREKMMSYLSGKYNKPVQMVQTVV